jgi:hypothetical protein
MRTYNLYKGGRALRIAMAITALVLLLAGGARATKFINDNPNRWGLYIYWYMECCIEDLHADN